MRRKRRDRALVANPNYAQGYYSRGFIGAHAGTPEKALVDLDYAERLSPFDPFLFAIRSSRAIALLLENQPESASACAVEASREPNAHFHIHAIAAICLHMIGEKARAREFVNRVLSVHPGYSASVFARSFPHREHACAQQFREALVSAGFAAE